MKDYYELLEVSKDASNEDIKKAYFSLIRKYNPENHPEEFKNIRLAYETLTDSELRKAYDEQSAVPLELRPLYEKALIFIKQGNYNKAIEVLKDLLKKDSKNVFLQKELGIQYLKNEEYSKAIKLFTKLIKNYPEDVRFYACLADAYIFSDSFDKAIENYKKALEIDNELEYAAKLLICYMSKDRYDEAYELMDNLIKEKEFINTKVYEVLLFTCCKLKKIDKIVEYLPKIKDSIKGDEERLEFAETLKDLSQNIAYEYEGFIDSALEIAKISQELNPDDKETEEFILETLTIKELDQLYDEEKIDEVIHDLIVLGLSNSDYEDEFKILCLKLTMLEDLKKYRKMVRYVKFNTKYVYPVYKRFFDDFINEKKEIKLYEETYSQYGKVRKKMLNNKDESERIGSKVGRNEPCPCGSGRKYKRCCG